MLAKWSPLIAPMIDTQTREIFCHHRAGSPRREGLELVMEGSFGLCLDHARPCRQHGSFISGPSRPSPSLNHPPRHALAHRCLWSGVGRASWAHQACVRCGHALLSSTWCCSARPSWMEDWPDEGYKRVLLPPWKISASFFLSYHSQQADFPSTLTTYHILNIF